MPTSFNDVQTADVSILAAPPGDVEEHQMKSTVLIAAAAAIVLVGAGCHRASSDRNVGPAGSLTENKLVNPKMTLVRGCLTGNVDQFVLTNIEQSSGATSGAQTAAPPLATTESYRLIGMDDQLKGFVGQRIEVTGDSVPDQVVDLVSATPAHPPASSSAGTTGTDAKVSTASRARVEIHELRVGSVNPLGDKCPGF
jgi:hypothetical protein